MSPDRYPYIYLWPRLIELVLFFLVLVMLIFAMIFGLSSSEPQPGFIRGLGILAGLLGVFLLHRQRTVYESCPTEASLLAGGLRVRGLNAVAKWRHQAANANVLLVVFGAVVSGYGFVWGAS